MRAWRASAERALRDWDDERYARECAARARCARGAQELGAASWHASCPAARPESRIAWCPLTESPPGGLVAASALRRPFVAVDPAPDAVQFAHSARSADAIR